ncbi:pyrroloquinoline-quinone synthase PqqC [Saccharopolyspora taberi]|uniref:Pyrroloquinoline-quinone synthase n=1 Tax=Saccharopolyspora taberi TaxID=60895 RepID=A0ABN3VI58_9PSEU
MTPRDAGEFERALRALETRYWHDHPFHQRLHRGKLDARELRLWAANRWYYQRCLPQKDAAIIANCPLPRVRRTWLERIAYHDGRTAADGGAQRWLQLAEALGMPREEVVDERHLLPGVRFAVDAYVNFARSRPWIEGVASGLTEMFAPGLMRRRVEAMREHYPWIAESGFGYFHNRIEATRGEGRSTLALVLEHCTTRDQQDAALAALAFKCDVLHAVLDAVDYEVGKR